MRSKAKLLKFINLFVPETLNYVVDHSSGKEYKCPERSMSDTFVFFPLLAFSFHRVNP